MKPTRTPEGISAAHWRKSSYSGGANSNCVEVASAGHHLALRDSKNPAGPVLQLGLGAWRRFVAERKAGTC
jgi:hypothetical protein